MEPKTTEITPTLEKNDDACEEGHCSPCAPPLAGNVAPPTRRPKGEVLAGAVDPGTEVGADVVAGAAAGGMAVEKIAAGRAGFKPVNSTAEHEFWRHEFRNRPYYTQGTPYEQYGPAYQYGWESFAGNSGKTFKEVEPQLGRQWDQHRGESQLSWIHVTGAAHDAWQRMEKAACKVSCC